MAVRGVQRDGRTGDILAVALNSVDTYSNFHVMFEGYDNEGDHCGVAEPSYPRCFKGLPPTGCSRYGKYLQVIDCEVETVDCPEFSIAGGHKYRLYFFLVMPENLKLFPFKQESVEEYVAWCHDNLYDCECWAAEQDGRAPVPMKPMKEAVTPRHVQVAASPSPAASSPGGWFFASCCSGGDAVTNEAA